MTTTLWYCKNEMYVIFSVTPGWSLPETVFFIFFIKYVFQAGWEIKKEAHRVCFQVTLQELLDLFLFLNKKENKNKSAFAIKNMTSDTWIFHIKEN